MTGGHRDPMSSGGKHDEEIHAIAVAMKVAPNGRFVEPQ
ncbi:hypothetical protein Y88_1859 [Novosphingobium nitrogenifigens DSM 19370]|uniref:Uncharacterized protein n=1 Tax=Novosphingobium nitrogenifigens DSM 19370 TaxID=983920 RepID=F1Z4Z4_9SPHN|nr:hypothetical protein Y88_1859 [Novosphingobium nitrogenifigens DSM 19370]